MIAKNQDGKLTRNTSFKIVLGTILSQFECTIILFLHKLAILLSCWATRQLLRFLLSTRYEILLQCKYFQCFFYHFRHFTSYGYAESQFASIIPCITWSFECRRFEESQQFGRKTFTKVWSISWVRILPDLYIGKPYLLNEFRFSIKFTSQTCISSDRLHLNSTIYVSCR